MKKGITLISVLAAVVIMGILTSTVTISAIKTTNDAKKIKFATEVSYITEAINNYYLKEQSLPIGESITIDLSQVSEKSITQFANEEGYSDKKIVLYKIDRSKLGISDTVYGNGGTDSKDIYAVSKNTKNVYYIKGISISGITYYTLTEDLRELIGYELSSNVVDNSFKEPFTLKATSYDTSSSSGTFFEIGAKSDITKVIFESTTANAPSSVIDVSSANDGSIVGWLDGTEAHIASDGQIYANPSSGFMFVHMSNLTEIENLNLLNTSKVKYMNWMFACCKSLKNIDLSNFNTLNVTDMSFMFYQCISLKNLDVSTFDTSKVDNMAFMFQHCDLVPNIDVSKFDTSNVTTMKCMFESCGMLKSLDLSKFDTSKVTDMQWMFAYCSKLTSLDLSSFNTENVTTMERMFYQCPKLTRIDVADRFVTSKVTSSDYMFSGCNNLVGKNGTKYNSSYTDKTYARIDTADTPGYFSQNLAISIGEKQTLITSDETKEYLYVTVNISSDIDIKSIKFEREIMSKEDALIYFKNNGIELQEDIIEVKEDTKGVTVYLEDVTGHVMVVSKEF